VDAEATRRQLVEQLIDVRAQFLASVEGLTDEEMTEPTIDGWSVKDHFMHLAFWHELRASEIVRISAGFDHAWPQSVDSQVLNDIVQPARVGLSLEQARWEYESAVQRVIAAIWNASERGLTQELYGEVGPLTKHELGHAEFIRNWRRRRGL